MVNKFLLAILRNRKIFLAFSCEACSASLGAYIETKLSALYVTESENVG